MLEKNVTILIIITIIILMLIIIIITIITFILLIIFCKLFEKSPSAKGKYLCAAG